MQIRIIIILFLSIILSLLTTSRSILLSYNKSQLLKLLNENERIKELEEYKDNKSTLKLKLQVIDVINSNRANHGLKPLELDILACRVASRTASEAVKGRYFGHWNLRGEKPYHRYAFAGVWFENSKAKIRPRSSSPMNETSAP